MPHKIGSFVFREKGGLIAAMQIGFCELDLDPLTVRPIVDPEPDKPDNRLNDGKCDRKGRFWCGSRDPTDDNPGGSLYRLDSDFRCVKMDSGFIISNGMAFSPDDRSLIFGDSTGEVIYRYDFDLEAGTIANRRDFLRTEGVPWVTARSGAFRPTAAWTASSAFRCSILRCATSAETTSTFSTSRQVISSSRRKRRPCSPSPVRSSRSTDWACAACLNLSSSAEREARVVRAHIGQGAAVGETRRASIQP
jgi:hypothetical protein